MLHVRRVAGGEQRSAGAVKIIMSLTKRKFELNRVIALVFVRFLSSLLRYNPVEPEVQIAVFRTILIVN